MKVDYQITYKINNYSDVKNINFNGNFVTKLFSSQKDSLVISRATKLNKETFKWLETKCKNFDKDSIKKTYHSLLNSDNNVAEDAFNLLKANISAKSNKILDFMKSGKKTVYDKFGLVFLSCMLEATKNNEQNHKKENLEFLDTVLKNIDSNTPTDYLDALVNSKDSDGNIMLNCVNLFNEFAKKKNTNNYSSFIKNLAKLPKREQNFIFNNFTKQGNEIFKTLSIITGKNSSDVLDTVEIDLKEYKIDSINLCLDKSKNKNGDIVLENYKKLIALTKNDKKLLNYSDILKDKKGDIQEQSIIMAQVLSKLVKEDNIRKFLIAAKDANGIVQKDFVVNLTKLLKENSKKDSQDNIIYCLDKLKNKNGDIQWNFVNIFALLKTFTDNNNDAQRHNTFDKIIELSKDKNGDIIPNIIEELPSLLNSNLLLIIPNIIKISKHNDTFNKDNFKLAKEVIKNTGSKEQYEMSEFLLTCIDKNGNIDKNKLNTIKEVQSKGIKYNAVKIANALNNPNNTISQRGLKLVEYLKKSSHNEIEKDLHKIIELCRDSSGFLNNDTIDCVKSYQKLNSHIELSEIIKLTLNSKKEVDTTKQKIITQILKDTKINDKHTLIEILHAARDKQGVIDLEVLKLATKLTKKGKNIKDYLDILPAFRKFYKYEYVTSLHQLNLRQKRNLMQYLKRHENDIYSPKFREVLDPKILPNNASEYCSIMAKLSHSVGTNVRKLPSNVEKNFYIALKNLADPKESFMNIDFNKDTPVLNLDYSLNDFKNDVWNIVKKSHYSDRTKALDYFGFELKEINGILELTGFPSAEKPDGKLASIKDKDVLALIKKLTPYIIKFSENNHIKIKNEPKLSADLTNIIRAFPEFLTTIGKVQHKTHDFTLDVHSLKVLQSVMKNPEFKTLSENSRRHAQMIALLHDLTKAELKPDPEHPDNSGFDTYYLLKKLNMKEKDKLKIYQVIRKHDWLTSFDFSDNDAKRVAFNMRENNSFKLLSLLTEADLKGVQRNNRFYLKYGSKLEKAKRVIHPYLYDLKRTAINLPQTKFPKASELNTSSPYVKTISQDGITNKVLYLRSGLNLKSIGFKTCHSTQDLNFLLHGLDNKNAASMFQALGMIDSKALLSTSYVIYDKGNYRAFRQEGFILDVPSTNIHVAYWRDFGSGYKKSVKDLFDKYLFNNNETRDYISNKIKRELFLSDSEYISLFKKIEDMPIEELENKYPKVARAYRKIFNDMEISKRNFNRNYNEILVTNPKIQAIFCYSKHPASVPSYLRKYAEKHDLPIVVLG